MRAEISVSIALIVSLALTTTCSTNEDAHRFGRRLRGGPYPAALLESLVAQRRGAVQDFTKNGNACSSMGVLS
jgi:hypothetical protein